VPTAVDGVELDLPMSFHQIPALGARIELVDASVRPSLLADHTMIDLLAAVPRLDTGWDGHADSGHQQHDS
jgi:hypothetical protein